MSKRNTKITRQQFAEEGRRIKKLKQQGKSAAFIKGWLRGWRMAGGVK